MFAMLYGEVNCLCIAVLALLLFKLRTGADQRRPQRLFSAVLAGNMATFFLDVLWPLANSGGPALRFWNIAVNGVYYTLTGLNAFVWFLYSETMLDSPAVRTGKRRALCALPCAVITILSLVSFQTGWFYFVDAAGVYHRGAFYPFQVAVVYGYIVAASLHALILSQRRENFPLRSKYLALSSYAVCPIGLGVLQIFLSQLPLANAGIMLSLVSVFISLQEQQISLDPLTLLNNRRQLTYYLSAALQHPSGGRQTFLLMADVDDFKQINDRFGHVEGDDALLRVADGLRAGSRGFSCFLARYGGDEFSVVCSVESETEVQALCRAVQSEIDRLGGGAPYTLALSIGYARVTAEISSVPELICRADEALYRVKQSRKLPED